MRSHSHLRESLLHTTTHTGSNLALVVEDGEHRETTSSFQSRDTLAMPEEVQRSFLGRAITSPLLAPSLITSWVTLCLVLAFRHDEVQVQDRVFLFFGGLTGFIPSLLVCASYYIMVSWRKHPTSIVFCRTLAEVLFSCRCMSLNALNFTVSTNQIGGCYFVSAITQFCLMTAECWFFVLALDLLTSVSNPFASYKRNMKLYHLFCWSMGIISAVILAFSGAAGLHTLGFCWVKSSATFFSDWAWGLWYFWFISFYLCAVAIFIYARIRLHSGLSSTFRIRKRVLVNSLSALGIFSSYWAVVFIWYMVYLTAGQPRVLRNVIQFLLGSKGLACAIVWFRANHLSQFILHVASNGFRKDTAVGDQDVDLSPQVNTALRKELLHFITVGVIESVNRAEVSQTHDVVQKIFLERQQLAVTPSLENRHGLVGLLVGEPSHGDTFIPLSHDSVSKDESEVQGLGPNYSSISLGQSAQVDRWFTSRGPRIVFKDYCPHLFRRTRELFHITNADYVKSLGQAAKEKLSEGASGAFMFFTKDGKYIVKSTTPSERDMLLSIIDQYTHYMSRNHNTFLTRFYGLHTISLYGQQFNFVVMANILYTERVINFRYDIKGSWVSRHADPVIPGKEVRCRHCNYKYKFGQTTYCDDKPGGHQPNVVLKDNDLTHKIKLESQTSIGLFRQLQRDSLFLCDLGIMDYSLMLGISLEEYQVDQKNQQIPTHTIASSGLFGESEGPRFRSVSSVLSSTSDVNPESPTNISVEMQGSLSPGTANRDRRRSVKSSSTTERPLGQPLLSDEESEPQSDVEVHAATSNDPLEEQLMQSSQHSPGRLKSASLIRPSGRDASFAIPASFLVGPGCYFIGLIDILQGWTWSKRMERMIKIRLLGKDGNGLSCIEPRAYQKRFEEKLRDIIGIPSQDCR